MESRAKRPSLMRGPASPFDEHERAENLSATRRRLIGYFAKDKLFIGGIFAAILAATGFDLAVPALQSRAIDVIAGQSSEAFFPLIMTAIIYLIIIWILTRVLTMLQRRLDPKIRAKRK